MAKRLYAVEILGVSRSVRHYQDKRHALARARAIAAKGDLSVRVVESLPIEWGELIFDRKPHTSEATASDSPQSQGAP